MRHENRNENRSRKKKRTSEASNVLAGTDASPGHLVMVYALFHWSEWSQYCGESEWSLIFHKIVNITCEWSHIYDESEWSLMISLIRRLGFPCGHSAGRSFREVRGSYALFAWTTCCSNQQNPSEATFRDGSFDHSVSSQVFSVGWRMHHVFSLSRIAESQAV